MKRLVIGLTQKVTIFGPKGKSREIMARIDTGAERSSIDSTLAAQLDLGPIIRIKVIRSSLGAHARPYIQARIWIKGIELKEGFTVADRRRMKYKVLIGQNTLRSIKAYIDPLEGESIHNESSTHKPGKR